MKSILKFVLFFALGLVTLVIIAAVALPTFINPNDYKSTIEEQVLKQTGRHLQIDGDIQLAFSFPLSVAFELGQTQLDNADGFGDKPFAKIKQISLKAALFPLLQNNQLNVDKVIVDQVFINLVRKKDGTSNWDDLAGKQGSDNQSTDKQTKPDASKGPEEAKKLPEFNIAGVEISNIHLIFEDQLNGQFVELKNLSLHSSEISQQKPIDVKFHLGESRLAQSAQSTQPIAWVKEIQFDAKIIPPFANQHVEIGQVLMQQLQLNLIRDKNGVANWEAIQPPKKDTASAPKSSPTTTKPNNQDNTTADKNKPDEKKTAPKISVANVAFNDMMINFDDQAKGQQFKFDDLNLKVSEVVENKPVSINISSHFESPDNQLDGQFDFAMTAIVNIQKMRLQLEKSSFKLDVNSPQIPGGKSSTQLDTDLLIDGQQQLLSINSMILKTMGLDIQTSLEAKQLLTAPQYSGSFKLAEFSPKSLSQRLQLPLPEMNNPKVLERAKLNLHFNGDMGKIQIKSLDAGLDDISLKGNAAITSFVKPGYRFNLAINRINLDDYTLKGEKTSKSTPDKKPPSNTEKSTPSKPAQTAKAEQPVFPVELLRQLNINGQLNIGELLASGIKMTNIVLGVKGNDGLVKIAPVKSDFYQGKLNLDTTINVRKKQPQVRVIQDFKQINLGQLLQDATGKQEFTGTANISSNISTFGNLQSTLIKNSHGKAQLLITDGHIKKMDILHTLRKAQALYKGEAMPTQQQEANTEFTELKGNLKIAKGVLHNNDLSAKSPVMALTGKGYVDLPKEYLDYTLQVQLLNTLSIDQKTDGTDYRSYKIPYTIKGKFDQLSQQADFKKVLAGKAKSELKKSLKKKLEGESGDKLKKKLGDDVGKKLEGILKF